MTKVYYKVGETFTNDYLIAIEIAEETDEEIITLYDERMYEPCSVCRATKQRTGSGFYPAYNEVPITMAFLVR